MEDGLKLVEAKTSEKKVLQLPQGGQAANKELLKQWVRASAFAWPPPAAAQKVCLL